MTPQEFLDALDRRGFIKMGTGAYSDAMMAAPEDAVELWVVGDMGRSPTSEDDKVSVFVHEVEESDPYESVTDVPVDEALALIDRVIMEAEYSIGHSMSSMRYDGLKAYRSLNDDPHTTEVGLIGPTGTGSGVWQVAVHIDCGVYDESMGERQIRPFPDERAARVAFHEEVAYREKSEPARTPGL